MITLSYIFGFLWLENNTTLLYFENVSYKNPSQFKSTTCRPVNTEDNSRTENRSSKSHKSFCPDSTSTDIQSICLLPPPHRKGLPISKTKQEHSLMQITRGKKFRLTINPKKINSILSCQPPLLSSKDEHHDKNAYSIDGIYTDVHMKRNICIYPSTKVTLQKKILVPGNKISVDLKKRAE